MNIYVMVKQVPDTETKIKLADGGKSVDTADVKWIMNPYDEFAVEEALKLKDVFGGDVVVVSLGADRVVDAMRTALAMGADRGVHVAVDEKTYLDNLMVAKALANAIKAEGNIGLVMAGKQAIDDDSASVPQMVAHLLDLPHVTDAFKMDTTKEKTVVTRSLDGGSQITFEVMLPAVVSTDKGLNEPRYASLPGIMKAKKKEVKKLSLSDVKLNQDDSKFVLKGYELPPPRPAGKVIDGKDTAEKVAKLVQLLRNEAKVI